MWKETWPWPRERVRPSCWTNLEPVLKILSNRKVIIVKPMLSYLYESCCGREDHAPNRIEDGFEEELQRNLGKFWLNFKKLLFLRNYRFKVVDPSPALPLVDEEEAAVWGTDLVHPLWSEATSF